MNYRIIEKQYEDGGTSYQVQRQVGSEWVGVFSAKDLERAKEVLEERRSKAAATERVLDL